MNRIALAAFTIVGWTGLVAAQDQRPIAEVPFQLIHNQIVLEVKVNGIPVHVLLDTDTDPSAIDLTTARTLGLKLRRKGHKGTGGGTDVNLAYETKLPLVQVGSIKAKQLDALAIDLYKIGERMGQPVQGVLGYNFLRDRVVQIDYPALKVRFYASSHVSAKTPSTETRSVIPFRYDNEVLIDDVAVNGRKAQASLDTGSSGLFGVTPAGIKTLGLENAVLKADEQKSVGYNGAFETKTGVLDSIRVGWITVVSTEAAFWLPGTGHDESTFHVNVGNAFLKNYVVTFDFPNKVVVLETPASR